MDEAIQSHGVRLHRSKVDLMLRSSKQWTTTYNRDVFLKHVEGYGKKFANGNETNVTAFRSIKFNQLSLVNIDDDRDV